MAKSQYELGKNPVIELELCGGNLTVKGMPESTLVVKGEAAITETELGVQIVTQDDLRLQVPENASLQIGQIRGNLVMKSLTGEISIDSIQGDAVLAGVENTNIKQINGDLVAKGSTGSLVLGEVHGDMAARNLAGITADTIHGDFAGRKITGPLRLSHVFGDISLRGNLNEGKHTLKANGDIVLRWPISSPLLFSATGSEIVNRMHLDEQSESDGTFSGRIGEGKTVLELEAGGRIIMKEADMKDEQWDSDDAGDWDFGPGFKGNDVRFQIETGISEHMAEFARQMESKFGPEFGKQISDKVSRKAEKAARRAERTAERYQRKAEQRERGFSFGFTPGATSTASPIKKTVPAEEQLKILKMVESGSITPDEADMLLEALSA